MVKETLLDLKREINYLQSHLTRGHISNISIIDSHDLLFSFSSLKQEKTLVSLSHQGPFLATGEFLNPANTISGLLNDTLRKELKDGFIESISLLNEDKIVSIKVIKSNDYFEKVKKTLILELIPHHPNLLLLDESNKIMFAAHYTNLNSERIILKNFEYTLPNKNDVQREEKETELSIFKQQITDYYSNSKLERAKEKFQPLLRYMRTRIKSLNKKIVVLEESIVMAKNNLIFKDHGDALLSLNDDIEQVKEYVRNNSLPYEDSFTVGLNANIYFKKYKKSKRTIEMNDIEIKKAYQEIDELNYNLNIVSYMNDEEMLDLAMDLMPTKFKSLKKSNNNKFSYILFENTKIYFGKNAKQNNELTFKFADKNDYYLHIKGFHGSHVIIRNPNPSNEMFLLASELCLILSNKEVGDVMYSPVKYLKKGNSLGEVLMPNYKIFTINKIRPETKEYIKTRINY